MYCLSRVIQLFYFFSYTFHFSHVEPVFSSTCLFEKPGNLGQMEEQDMFRPRNCCGRSENWEKAQGEGAGEGKAPGNRKRSRVSSHRIYSAFSHNIFSCCQHSQAHFFLCFLPSFLLWQEPFQVFFTPLDGSDLSNLSHLICFCAALTGMHSVPPHLLTYTGNDQTSLYVYHAANLGLLQSGKMYCT